MVDLDDRQRLLRGEKAKRILEDPIFVESFDMVRQAIYKKIEECPIRDTEGLRILRLELKILSDVKANLLHTVNTGKVTAERINWLERVKKGIRA